MIAAIIQARVGSSRLPRKVLKDVNGMPMLQFQIGRVLDSTSIDKVVVATTTLPEDNEIEDLCQNQNIPCYRGSENDVLSRYFDCALAFNADIIVRLTGDCPFVDPLVIDNIISQFLASNSEYIANTVPLETSMWPDGSDVEVFSMDALERANREAMLPEDREHVTFYFWKPDNAQKFNTLQFSNSQNWSKYRFTVDYPEDYQVTVRLLDKLNQSGLYGHINEIVDVLEAYPDIQELNSKYYFGIGWKQ